ncbi:hypothetical protein [Salinimicrobium sp. GXAS 041]|uniref:hypothetical protein n=1 Tax=Salinimicrobium sp. GXAS 041 TaxID=3400806 RepID=UPI003C77B350
MNEKILSNIHQPAQLEQLYRANKALFTKEFKKVYPQIQEIPIAHFWNERLQYESDTISWGSRKDFLFILITSLLAGLLAKFPVLFGINEEFFFPRNISFLVLPFLTTYFAWKNKWQRKGIIFMAAATAICAFYVNSLPYDVDTSDSLILVCIHLPLLLWVILGVSFAGNDYANHRKRLAFLRFNGDLLVMSALLVLAGIITTGITIGLFQLIGYNIEEFYFEYIVVFVLPAVPITATYLTQTNPQLVNKVSPVIAKIFSPLVLLMLLIYLGAIVFSGKNPYIDREFLLLFNILLIGVMALIFFSVAESASNENSASGKWILLLLSVATILVNGIALSAILFRIFEGGFTPNRIAVLGSNILMLIHLLILTYQQFEAIKDKEKIVQIEKSIAAFLPVYLVWVLAVVFLLPFIFNFQ